MDRTDRQFYITLLAEYMFFSDLQGTFSRRHHVLGHKIHLNIFQKTDIIQSIFSDHSGMKLDINKRMKMKICLYV